MPRPENREGIDGGSTRAGGSAGPLFGEDQLERPRPGQGPDLERLVVVWARSAGSRGITSLEAHALYRELRNPSDPDHGPDVFGALFTALAMAGRLADSRQVRGGRRVVVVPDVERGAPASSPAIPPPVRAAEHLPAPAAPPASPWEAEVPFDAGRSSTCSGCPATIGWVERAEPPHKAHPVEMRGYVGVVAAKGDPGPWRSGYTSDGFLLRIRRDLYASKADRVVVFESHFGHCRQADRFKRRPS